MDGYINIIKSGIISSRYDEFWKDVSTVISDAIPRQVLVIVNAYQAGSPEALQLKKMLDACKLTGEQHNTIFLKDGQQVAWRLLREKLNPQIVFLIGIMPAQLGISALFQINEPNHFNDRIWLATVSLNELEQNAEVKKRLWQNGMKPVFVDKLF